MVKEINTLVASSSHEWLFHHPKHDPLKKISIPSRPLSTMSVNGASFGSDKMHDQLNQFHRMKEALRRRHKK